MTMTRPLLSVVSPVYEEEEALPYFHRVLGEVLDGLAGEYDIEIVYVDDGSRDGTLPLLRRMTREDPRVRYHSLSRNFGHQAALTAGLERARGDVVVTLDSDLQHPPSLIPALLARWREGFDVVATIRADDRSLGWFKRLTSRGFYGLMRWFSDTEIRAAAADFRLMSRRAVQGLLQLKESHRFLRGMVHWLGFPTTEVHFSPAARAAGVSKYTVGRMLRFAADGVLSFSRVPLRLPLYLGVAAGAAGLAYGAWLLTRLATGTGVRETSLALMLLLLIGGAVLCSLGVLGEYVGRIYEQVKGRPLYVVKESHDDAGAGRAADGRDEAA
jgi:dolichol-phosphate mannosyltransferase